MKLVDIIAMALHNLRERRLRTALNLLGVVIGCIVLLMTAAGASGVSQAFHALLDSSEFARQIEIHQSWSYRDEPPADAVIVKGTMSDERRERIRKRMIQKWKYENSTRGQAKITKEMVDRFKGIEHVVAVVPNVHLGTTVRLVDPAENPELASGMEDETETVTAAMASAGPPSVSMKRTLLCGEMLEEDDSTGILLHEFLAYQLGFHGDDDLSNLIGRDITIERKIEGKVASLYHVLAGQIEHISPEYLQRQGEFLIAFNQLIGDLDKTTLSDEQKKLLRTAIEAQTSERRDKDDIVIHKTFTVRGIYRAGANQSMAAVFRQQLSGEHVDMQVNREVASELYLQDPETQFFYNVVVIVDSSQNLKTVTEKIQTKGIRVYSALNVIENIDYQIERNSWVVFALAAAILITAAIGISNTLFISVMERTPEFGILKALGAKDRDLLMLMISEGAVLGLLGAVGAVLLSWLLSFGLQFVLQMYLQHETGSEISGNMFRFSLLPILLTLAIAIVVCVAASIAPALRAARLDPVIAMRRV